jgi:phospholipid/cholesterol/gamma-HCH transport system permease protein
MITRLGSLTLNLVEEIGNMMLFMVHSAQGLSRTRRRLPRLLRATVELGTRCLPVILIVGTFTGLVLGLQGYHVLRRFGSESLLGTLVSLSLVRELGPVLAALMLVGQAGSAIAAELGIQRNSEQIAALESMGVHAEGYLVGPRLVGALWVYPLQTALFVAMGLIGGWLSGTVLLGLESGVYWNSVDRAVSAADWRECLCKSVTFALICTSICCHQGYNAHRVSGASGSRAVSTATTRAVVLSCMAILAADYLITSLLM